VATPATDTTSTPASDTTPATDTTPTPEATPAADTTAAPEATPATQATETTAETAPSPEATQSTSDSQAESPTLDTKREALETEARDLYTKGLYAAAMAKAEELWSLLDANYGPDNINTIRARLLFVQAQEKAGYFPEAIVNANTLLSQLARVSTNLSPEYLQTQDILILAYLHSNYLDEETSRIAFELADNIYTYRKNFLGANNLETFIALRELINSKSQLNTITEDDLKEMANLVSSMEETLGVDDPNTMEARHLYTNFYFNAHHPEDGPVDEATEKEVRELVKKTVDGRKKLYGEIHPDVSEAMSVLAFMEMTKENYQEAFDIFLKMSDIEVKTLGPDHPWSVNSYIVLATCLRNLGKVPEILPYLERALESSLRFFGADNKRTINLRIYLAFYYYQDMLNVEKSLEIFNQILAWQEANLGAEHQDTLTTLSNIAAIYNETGNFEGASAIYERVLKTRMSILGPNHEDTLMTSSMMAYQQILEGNTEKAKELYEGLLQQYLTTKGPEDLETLNIQITLALIYSKEGNNQKARALLEQVSAIISQIKGPEDPMALDTYAYLTKIYYELGELNLALDTAISVLAARERALGLEHLDTVTSRHHLSQIYLGKEDYMNARPILEELVRNQTDLFGPQDPRTLMSRTDLANTYRLLGQKALAKKTYIDLLTDLESIHGARDPLTNQIRNELALVF
jgi:Tfp pilus assembly protein PilF